jgi:LPXTG-motif cell wall-anchored protein
MLALQTILGGYMKKFLTGLVLAAMLALTFTLSAVGSASATSDDTEKKVVICHAAGQAGTTHYNTLEISENAVYGRNGNAGHFEENGTPQAGHEQDYFGPCVTPTETVTPTPTPTETVVVTPTPTVTVTTPAVVTPTPETPVAIAPPVKTQKPTATPTKTHKAKPTHPAHPVTPVPPKQHLAHTGAANTTLLGGLGLGLIAGGIALYRRFAPTA